MKPSDKVAKLTQLIAPAVLACDVELWGIEFLPQGRKALLRIYIDRQTAYSEDNEGQQSGVTVEDCAKVTHQVSGILEVYDPIAGEHILEVSSPGLDRRFFKLEQLQDYVGQTVQVRTIYPIKQQRKWTGQLTEVDLIAGKIALDTSRDTELSDAIEEFSVDNIDKAQLIYQDDV